MPRIKITGATDSLLVVVSPSVLRELTRTQPDAVQRRLAAIAAEYRCPIQWSWSQEPDPVTPESLGALIDRAEDDDDSSDTTSTPVWEALDAALQLLEQNGVRVPLARNGEPR